MIILLYNDEKFDFNEEEIKISIKDIFNISWITKKLL